MKRRAFALLFSVAVFAALATACGSPDRGRVFVLGLDGLDPQTIDLMISEGQLPNFARLRREGAYGPLLSQKPLLSPIVWTTIATGRQPTEHGISHFVAKDQDGQDLPVTSTMRNVKALWNVASDYERTVASVGWWATWPPEAVNGVMVSDHVAYHFLFEDGFTGGNDSGPKVFPPAAEGQVTSLLVRPEALPLEDLSRFASPTEEDLAREFDLQDELSHLRWAIATAQSHTEIGLDLWRRTEPDLQLLYIEGTDSTAHLFGHLFRRDDLGGAFAEQRQRYGNVVEEMYRYADEVVGRVLDEIDGSTTLMVLSDHGFQLGALHDDPSQAQSMKRVSERFHRDHGVLFLYGRGIKQRALIQDASILDITPTVLSLLGIPASQEMPGRVLSEVFSAVDVPTRVTSHESEGGRTQVTQRDAEVDAAVLERLRSLGYLSGSDDAAGTTAGSGAADAEGFAASAAGRRNLAAMQFEQGNYREAGEIYSQLVAEDPQDAALHSSLAGVLGAMGRLDRALEELDEAIELDPLVVEAHHNRGVIFERQGKLDEAIAAYRTGLRYVPDFIPSRQALSRLGAVGSSAPEGDVQALAMAEQASQLARRGSYSEALALIDQAIERDPDLALLYQYRANVLYLDGDREGAIAALRKGLEIEPDNALFRTNIERLQQESGN